MVFKASANDSSLPVQEDWTGKWNPWQSPVSSAAMQPARRDCVWNTLVSKVQPVLSFSPLALASPQPLQYLGDGKLKEDHKSGQTDAGSPSADWQATIARGWGRRCRRKAGLGEKFPWPCFFCRSMQCSGWWTCLESPIFLGSHFHWTQGERLYTQG